MKKKMNRLWGTALSFALVFSLSACSVVTTEQESNGTTASADSEESVVSEQETTTEVSSDMGSVNVEPALSGEVELQIFTNESDEANAAWTEVVNAFEEATGLTANVHMGSQVNEEMDSRWMQGNPPDFVWLNGAGLNDAVFQESGLFKDITSVLEEGYVYGTDKKLSDVIDDNMLNRTAEGAVYRAPVLRTTHGIWYDAKYFRDNGYTVPANYSEFVKESEQAVSNGIAAFTYAGQYPSYVLGGMIYPAIAAYGQDYFVAVGTGDIEALESENMTSILTRWRDYCANDGFLLPGTATLDHTTSQIRWLAHETLFIPVGLWLPGEVANSTPEDFEITYAPSPLIEDSQKTTVVYTARNAAIAENARNPENAEAFLRFLYTEEAQTILMNGLSDSSVLNDLDYESATTSLDKSIADAFATAAAAENQVYNNVDWGELGTTFGNVLNELAIGDITVEDAQAALVSTAQEAQEN